MAINFTGFGLALARGPFWGLLVYMNIYFNSPRPYINWWVQYMPDIRWSLLSSVVLIASIVIHRKKTSEYKLYSIKWGIAFMVWSGILTLGGTFETEDARYHLFMLLSYCMAAYFIVKSVKSVKQYRALFMTVIVLASNLSINAFLYGKRIHARLENIGTVDSFGSNEFALLLAGVIPFTLPFLICGKVYEKIICIVALPFLLNAFILCNSRGAFVAGVLSVLLIFVVLSDRKVRQLIIICMLCAVPIFIYLADDYFIDRLRTLIGIENAALNESDIDKISSGRTEIWRYGMDMVSDYPLGAGPNSFKQLARFYMPDDVLTYHPGAEHGIRSAHNTYLQLLVEHGIFGFCIFILMVAHTMFLLYKALRKLIKYESSDLFLKYSTVAIGLSFGVTLFGGLFASRIYYEFFWWQIAFAVITYSFIIRMEQKALESHTG